MTILYRLQQKSHKKQLSLGAASMFMHAYYQFVNAHISHLKIFYQLTVIIVLNF